jgi:UDP-2,3-diacylglucosamine hydrolase
MPHAMPIVVSGVCYFASDFHFGAPNLVESKKRELLVMNWLENIQKDAKHLFLLGDIFDFWFEYDRKPPALYVDFLNKIDALRKKGVEIYFFTGNHDMWVKNYLKEHLGIHIFRKKQEFIINGKKFLLAHGDGMGKGEFGYKCLKVFLNCRINRWLFGLIPSKIGFAIAHYFSRKSRAMTPGYKEKFLGNEKELLVQFCFQHIENHNIDFYIFGHRHLPLEIEIKNAIYFNTGDWLNHNTYIRYESWPVLCCFNP